MYKDKMGGYGSISTHFINAFFFGWLAFLVPNHS